MNLDNIRVSRRLWGVFLGVMALMLLLSVWAQNRSNGALSQAIDDVTAIEAQVSLALRWKGATEHATTMVVGSAVTTDPALAQHYDQRVKELIAGISKIQAAITEGAQLPEDKQALEKIAAVRKTVLAAVAKVGEIKKVGDAAATQSFVDKEVLPLVASYLGQMDEFIKLLEQRRDRTTAEAKAKRFEYGVSALIATGLLWGLCLLVVRSLVRSVTQPLAEAVRVTDAIAAGDLTQELVVTRQDEFGHMLGSLATMSQRLRSLVGEVRGGVDSMSNASSEIAHGNQDLSARTEQTASNLQQTAASMEQLTSTVTQAADTARQANQLASTAAQAATRGGEVVGQVVTSMQHITDSSHKISDIIGVIDGIAFQTNILALNAAVEAARAGEQGRGFAVVAGEVRTLAQRSAEAAKEIKGLINASVETVESGSQQVAEAGTAMDEIVGSVRRVSDLIAEISASSGEQREGIGQVNAAVSQLDQMTQQNAALVEESAAAAASLRDQAQRLSGVVSVFNVGHVPPPAARPVHRPAPAPAMARPAAPAQLGARPAPAKAAAPAAQKLVAPKAAPAPAPKAATGGDEDWETF